MDCPRCGYAMSAFDSECERCKRMQPPEAQPEAELRPERRGMTQRAKLAVVGGVAAAILLVALGPPLAQRGKAGPKRDAETAVAAPALPSGQPAPTAPTAQRDAPDSVGAARPETEAATVMPTTPMAPAAAAAPPTAPATTATPQAAVTPEPQPAAGRRQEPKPVGLAQLDDDQFAWIWARMVAELHPSGLNTTDAFFMVVMPPTDRTEGMRRLLAEYGTTTDEVLQEFERRTGPGQPANRIHVLRDKMSAGLPAARAARAKTAGQ